MLATPVGPNVLLNWFWHGQHPFTFLVLLAAGDAGQAAFYRDVFEQKENIDVVSGEDIAVFLFSEKPAHTVALNGDKPGEKLIMPAEPIKSGTEGWRQDPRLSVIRVNDLQVKDRDVVVRQSMRATSELMKCLTLDERHIPAILVLSKAVEDDVLIVKTHDVASVRHFLAFLRDLRALARSLPTDMLATLATAAKESRSLSAEEYYAVRGEYQELMKKLRASMAKIASSLVKHGLPHNEAEHLLSLHPDTSTARILKNLRLAWMVPVSDMNEAAIRAVRAAAQDDAELQQEIREVRILLRTVHQVGNRHRKLDRALRVLTEARDRTSMFLLAHEKRLTEMDDLAARYEAKFFWMSKAQSIGRFVALALGVGKQAKDFSEIVQVLNKIGRAAA